MSSASVSVSAPIPRRGLHPKQKHQFNSFFNVLYGIIVCCFHKTNVAIIKPYKTNYACIKLNSGGFKTISTLLVLNKILQGTRYSVVHDETDLTIWYVASTNGKGVPFHNGMEICICPSEIERIIVNLEKEKKMVEVHDLA